MENYKIGVISDTHGLLRKDVKNLFNDCKLIIHAGDIGNIEIVKELETLAPVVAVRGNCDRHTWAEEFSYTEMIEIENFTIYILHNLEELDLDPQSAGVDIVISGHSHRSSLTKKEGVLFLNPGSSGPKRFNLPISVAVITINDKKILTDIIEL